MSVLVNWLHVHGFLLASFQSFQSSDKKLPFFQIRNQTRFWRASRAPSLSGEAPRFCLLLYKPINCSLFPIKLTELTVNFRKFSKSAVRNQLSLPLGSPDLAASGSTLRPELHNLSMKRGMHSSGGRGKQQAGWSPWPFRGKSLPFLWRFFHVKIIELDGGLSKKPCLFEYQWVDEKKSMVSVLVWNQQKLGVKW